MLRSLVGVALVFVLGLLAVGVTFSASSQQRADYVFVSPMEPKSLDPGRINGEPEGRAVETLFEGLTRLDPKTLRPVPGVAERWEISADGKRYVFHLRHDARWSDGRPVTAHDFTYAWRRIEEPRLGAEYAYILHPVRYAEAFNTFEGRASSLEGPVQKALGVLARAHPSQVPAASLRAFSSEQHLQAAIKGSPDPYLKRLMARPDGPLPSAELPRLQQALAGEARRLRAELAEASRRYARDGGVFAKDDHTLVVELNAPTPYFLELTAFYPTYPVPRWVVEREGLGDSWYLPEHLVGNGAFRLAAWRVGDRMRLERSSTYWDKQRVRLNTIDILPVENGTTALNLYLSGQVDWLPTGTYPVDLADELKKRPDFYKGPALIVYYYRINCTRKPFTDPRVRKALNLAVDRESIVRDVLGLGQLPAYHYVPPGIAGYEPPPTSLEKNLDAARALLAEAGFPGGRGFPKFGLLYNTLEMHKKLAEVLADQLRRGLGLEVTAYNQEWQSYQSSTQLLDYDLARAGWVGDYEDPSTFLNLWVTNGGNNQTGWGNATYDRLISATEDIERALSEPGELLPLLKEPGPARALLEQATQASEPAQRLELANRLRMVLFREAESILLNSEFPIIPLYFYVNNGLVAPRVKGFYRELETPDGKKRPNLREFHPASAIYIEEPSSGG
jgi:oligopeptide transport system substrate-binding protein